MKKIFKILLILFLFLSCYLIYKFTENDKINYLAIGNNSDFNNYVISNMKKNVIYNDSYISDDYRIIDLVNIIKYNEVKDISIHQLLKSANILTIFVGMNELYSKLDYDTRDIYNYLNNMILDMNDLFVQIDKYEYDNVYILGYYNNDKINDDIFSYVNYKLRKLTNEYGYIYIDTNTLIEENDLVHKDSFKLNENGLKKISKIILAYNKKT